MKNRVFRMEAVRIPEGIFQGLALGHSLRAGGFLTLTQRGSSGWERPEFGR